MPTFKYLLCTIVPTVLGAPFEGSRSLTNTGTGTFVWGSVGDSWASGVSYSTTQHTDYDDDKDGCHRWKDSYGPIMEKNTAWTINPQQFNFAACSGAQLLHVVKEKQGENPPQMDMVGSSPQMITYHAGGNNCGFGAVNHDCVYQPKGDYGPEYPDPDGQCAIQLRSSNGYINNNNPGGLYQDEIITVRNLLDHPAVKDNKDFKLYMLGNAYFFNPGANYCDDISFGALASAVHGPKTMCSVLSL